MSTRSLPVSSIPGAGPQNARSGCGRDERIRRLVRHFYDIARFDPMLGPVFESHVSDWDRHLETMHDFWSSAVDRTGRYSGAPFAAHQRLPGLRDEHFTRWLTLWRRAVSDIIATDDQEPFLHLASMMRVSMATRLGLRSASRDGSKPSGVSEAQEIPHVHGIAPR